MNFFSKYKKIYFGLLLGIVMCFLFVGIVSLVHAQANPVSGGTTALYDPLNSSGDSPLNDLLQKIINYLTMISTPIITAMVLWGGIQILLAQDNATKFKKGIDTVKHAAIGAVIVILSDGILLIVKDIIGLK